MKKKLLLLGMTLLFGWGQSFSQAVNQPANWPNAGWTVSGTYSAPSLLADPTVDPNLSYDDDAAGSGSTDSISVVSPVIDLTTAQTATENLMYVNYEYDFNNGDIFEIQYWDADLADWVSWETLADNSSETSAWCSQLTGTLTSSQALDISGFSANQLTNFQYRILYDASSAYGWGFCMGSPTLYSSGCYSPTNLTTSNVTSSTVDVSWTAGGTETMWNIEYGPAGFAQGTGTTVPATATTETITGLTGNTTYDVYVQADCGAGDLSPWLGPVTFTTPCSAVAAPWTEDFENAGVIPDCWAQGAANAKDWEFADNGGFDHIGDDGTINGTTSSNGYFAWLDDSSPHSTGTALLSPMIDVTALTTPMLRFYLLSNNEGNTNVDFSVDVWDGAAWNTGVFTSNSNTQNGAWEQITVYLNSLTITGDMQLRFVVDENNGTDFYDDVAIDDVEILEAPTCFPPSDLQASNITATSAELSWTANGPTTTWNVEYGPEGFTLGNGTVVTGVGNPAVISGLNGKTTYDFYVSTDCGGGDISDTIGPVSFNTPGTCGFFELSLEDSWGDGWNGGFLDVYVNGVLEYPGVTIASGSGPEITQIAVDINDVISIEYTGGSFTSENSYELFDDQGVVVVTEGDGGETPNNFGDPAVPYGAVACATCPTPTDITLQSVSSNSADVSWTVNGAETDWVIEYDTTGFVPGTGNVMATTNNPETITGLMPNTTYDVYVRAVCSTSDTSFYYVPFTFTTECVTYMAPFLEEFNSGVQPDCWDNLSSEIGSTDDDAYWDFDGGPGYGANNNGRPDGTFAWSDGSTPNPDSVMLITPSIDMSPLTEPYLEFDWFSNNEDYPGDNVPLIIDVLDNGVWKNIDTLATDSINWMTVNYDLDTLSGQTVKFRFMTNQALTINSAYYNDILLDNVKVDNCNPVAGQDGSFDFCRLDDTLNLNDNVIVKGQMNGRWTFPTDPSKLVNDSLLVVTSLPATSYEAFYVVDGICSDDTTVATINVFPPSSAGQNGSIEVCQNEPINLFAGLSGNVDLGGDWYDPSNNLLPNSQPTASNIPGIYNYDYITSNGVCPADTALLEVEVLSSCDWLSIGTEELNEISVYPNPATNMINIVNPANTSSLKVEIFDVNGRIVATDDKALENSTEGSIAIDHLETGIYTLRVYGENGQKTFKIVKK